MNTYHLMVALALTLVSLCVVGSGQQNVDQDEKIVTSTNLVTVNVVVTEGSGAYVTDLTQKNFRVYDNGIEQKISNFSFERGPVSLGIVVEVSEGRAEGTRAILNVLRAFTRTLRDEDDFFLVSFGRGGSITTGFVPTFEQVSDLQNSPNPDGLSSLYDAVFAVAGQLRTKPNLKKAILIVSNGQDRQSNTSYEKLRSRLREFDVQVYAIGRSNSPSTLAADGSRWVFEDVTRNSGWRAPSLDPDVAMGRAVLAELSRVSGGATYFPEAENESELMAICTQTAVELRKQYTLGFYPTTNPTKRPHRLRITVETPNVRSGISLWYRDKYQPYSPHN